MISIIFGALDSLHPIKKATLAPETLGPSPALQAMMTPRDVVWAPPEARHPLRRSERKLEPQWQSPRNSQVIHMKKGRGCYLQKNWRKTPSFS